MEAFVGCADLLRVLTFLPQQECAQVAVLFPLSKVATKAGRLSHSFASSVALLTQCSSVLGDSFDLRDP